jgi:hypothetical protein
VARPLQTSLLSLLCFALLLCPSAKAQISCGEAPKDVPVSVQEALKGDLEGKAQVLSKLIGDAQIKGKIESTRNEIHQEHQNLDQYQLDMYFMWVACQTLNSDKLLSTQDKIKLWTDVLLTFNSRPTPTRSRNPNALYQYGEAVADVQGAIIAQAQGIVTFKSVHTGGKADPSREVEYQDWVLMCPQLPAPPPGAIVGQFSGMVVGSTCTIVRRRE